jgi:hypothetical protein
MAHVRKEPGFSSITASNIVSLIMILKFGRIKIATTLIGRIFIYLFIYVYLYLYLDIETFELVMGPIMSIFGWKKIFFPR